MDKNLGVRPIGVGEVVRSIIAKAVLSIVGTDIQQAAGPLQLCAGHIYLHLVLKLLYIP